MFILPLVIIGIAAFVICRVLWSAFISGTKRPDSLNSRSRNQGIDDESGSSLPSMMLLNELTDQVKPPTHGQTDPVHPSCSDVGSMHPTHAAHPVHHSPMEHSAHTHHMPMDQSLPPTGGHHHG